MLDFSNNTPAVCPCQPSLAFEFKVALLVSKKKLCFAKQIDEILFQRLATSMSHNTVSNTAEVFFVEGPIVS